MYSHKYDDIINLPHHKSLKHPPMDIRDRAAQFAPFAALTGFNDAIEETARLTDEKISLTESSMESINNRLMYIKYHPETHLEVSITYFLKDDRKEGGSYISKIGSIKKIDEFKNIILMDDGSIIPIGDILDITGEIFGKIK